MRKILSVIMLLCAWQASAQNTFKLPAYEKFKLKNGLTIYLMEQHEVPLVYATAVFDAGSVYDGTKEGLAGLTAGALQFGTKKYSKAQLEEASEFVGSSIRASADQESATVSTSFSVNHQSKIMELFQQVIQEPVFDAEEFDKYKKRVLLQLVQQKESPRSVIGNYENGLLFGNHPYAQPESGTVSSVEKITVADVKAFYQKYYTLDKAAIAVVGDFKSAEMKKLLTTMFGNWTTAKSTAPKLTAPNQNYTRSRVLLVNKDDARETTFHIAGKGIAYNHPDYVPILVINTILGDRFTSWLNDALRVNSGLTYGARSSFTRYKLGGIFSISTFTQNSTTVEAIDMALQVLDSLHTTGVDEKTLNSAKAYVKGDFPPNYESGGALSGLLTDMFIYGFDESLINTFQTRVDGLTVARAKEIIAAYFPKSNFQFVLIGKASEIREKVKKYGELTEKEIKAEGF